MSAKWDKMDVEVADDQEDDPITASYPVFLNPALPLGRQLLVLQQPNRTDDTPRPPPTELRLKTHSGMVEVDMPLDNTVAYDREKGLKWGRTLQASMVAKNGGSHGLAGGFGFGAVQQRGKKKGDDDDDSDEYLDWTDAVRQDKVLRTQTLGGQNPTSDEVQHMVGVFQGKNLHLTPVSSLIHLRPQLHHLDAATQQEKNAAGGGSKDAGTGAASAARAIHMTIKTPGDGEAVTTETMADRLRSVQTENWRKMRYTDENEEGAWDIYNESLFLRPKEAPSGADKDLEPLVPKYSSKWGSKQLLEAVSGITQSEREVKPEPKAEVAVKTEEGKKPRSRSRGGSAAATGTKRASRAKGPKATINID